MEYLVEISNFEGPLDLLLHLVKQSEMDIYDINIDQISKQYLDYIHNMEKMNLNVASEYLVMGAELMEIKSYSLLPKHEEELEDDFEEDPREALISRLVEYEKYKNVTSSLKDFERERLLLHSKEATDLTSLLNKDNNDIDENFDMQDLVNAFNEMLKRKKQNEPLATKVTSKEYSITERSSQIKNILKSKKKVEFSELFDIYSKDYIVVTFLSILNMARHNELLINQDKNFGKIFLEAGE